MSQPDYVVGIDPSRSTPRVWINNRRGLHDAWAWRDDNSDIRGLYFANRTAAGFILGDELVGPEPS